MMNVHNEQIYAEAGGDGRMLVGLLASLFKDELVGGVLRKSENYKAETMQKAKKKQETSETIVQNMREVVEAFKLGPGGGTHQTTDRNMLLGVLLGCVSTCIERGAFSVCQIAKHVGAGHQLCKTAMGMREQVANSPL